MSNNIPPSKTMLSEANLNNPTGGSDACVHSSEVPLLNQHCMRGRGFTFELLSRENDRIPKYVWVFRLLLVGIGHSHKISINQIEKSKIYIS